MMFPTSPSTSGSQPFNINFNNPDHHSDVSQSSASTSEVPRTINVDLSKNNYVCTICTDQKTCKCDLCGDNIAQNKDLTRRRVTYTDEQSFESQISDQSYNTKFQECCLISRLAVLPQEIQLKILQILKGDDLINLAKADLTMRDTI